MCLLTYVVSNSRGCQSSGCYVAYFLVRYASQPGGCCGGGDRLRHLKGNGVARTTLPPCGIACRDKVAVARPRHERAQGIIGVRVGLLRHRNLFEDGKRASATGVTIHGKEARWC